MTRHQFLFLTIFVTLACALGVVSCISYLADGDVEVRR
jgi:hypothetical protein